MPDAPPRDPAHPPPLEGVDEEPGAVNTTAWASQDATGVDMSLVDKTLSLTPDERVKRLDAWINGVRRLRAELHVQS